MQILKTPKTQKLYVFKKDLSFRLKKKKQNTQLRPQPQDVPETFNTYI